MSKQVCEICGNLYVYSCPSCMRRVRTWGEEGTIELIKLSKTKDDIQASFFMEFIEKYYIGKATSRSDKSNVLKVALRNLGYKGNFIGSIRNVLKSHYNFRIRENQTARRWKLKNDSCDLCGETEDLYLHHIVPLSWGGVSSIENCVTLCKKCHLLVHKKLSKSLNRSLIISYLKPHKNEIERLASLSIDIDKMRG